MSDSGGVLDLTFAERTCGESGSECQIHSTGVRLRRNIQFRSKADVQKCAVREIGHGFAFTRKPRGNGRSRRQRTAPAEVALPFVSWKWLLGLTAHEGVGGRFEVVPEILPRVYEGGDFGSQIWLARGMILSDHDGHFSLDAGGSARDLSATGAYGQSRCR